MSTVAGGLGVRMEKVGHYTLGEGRLPRAEDIREAVRVMRTTALLFFLLFLFPAFFLVGIRVQLFLEDLLIGLW